MAELPWKAKLPAIKFPVVAFGTGRDHCICRVLKPIIRPCQLLGILPISHDSLTCKMEHKWKSYPVVFNIFWISLNSAVLTFMGISTNAFFGSVAMNGIDMLTFGLVNAISFVCTMLAFLFGNYTASRFTQLWTTLHAAIGDIAMANFHQSKCRIYFFPLYMILDFIFCSSTFYWATSSGETPLGQNYIIMVPVLAVMSNVIPNLISVTFSILVNIIRKNFQEINRKIEILLEANDKDRIVFSHGSGIDPIEASFDKIANELIKYKRLHEMLCESVRFLQETFAFQLLFVFITTGLSFVAGIYGAIVATQVLDVNSFGSNVIGYAFGITSIAGSARMILVILACQGLVNEANATAHILNQTRTESPKLLTQRTEAIIKKFLKKLAQSPLKIKCCNIFELGNHLLAAVTSNVVTYVLILMQFRQDNPTP